MLQGSWREEGKVAIGWFNGLDNGSNESTSPKWRTSLLCIMICRQFMHMHKVHNVIFGDHCLVCYWHCQIWDLHWSRTYLAGVPRIDLWQNIGDWQVLFKSHLFGFVWEARRAWAGQLIISKDENPKPSTKLHVGLLVAATKSTYATSRQ